MTLYRCGSFSLLTCLLLLSACHQSNETSTSNTSKNGNPTTTATTAIGRTVETALKQARTELANENISISDDAAHLPKAEITPAGDLLIDSKLVVTDANQKAMLLAYRAQIIKIAEAGIDIGAQGADLAGKAIGQAISGVFAGNTDQVEQRVEAEADKIETSAKKLCDLLPALLDKQQKLAVAMPVLKPYATMTQDDIVKCYKEDDHRN